MMTFTVKSEGEYWSLSSMTIPEKATYVGLNVWHLFNLIAVGHIFDRIVKRLRSNKIGFS